jgi:hypothetical protein
MLGTHNVRSGLTDKMKWLRLKPHDCAAALSTYERIRVAHFSVRVKRCKEVILAVERIPLCQDDDQ